MSELFTFKPADQKFLLTVKSEFRNKCPNPEKLDTYELMTRYRLNQFLHNPVGPAIVRLKDNYIEYWLEGQKVSEEVGKRIAHNQEFASKLADIVDDKT
jgi:hypothetical protein